MGLDALKPEKRGVAAGAERALHVSLRGHHVSVVHASIIATQDDEGLTARESGRPLQLSLNEARVTGTTKGRGSEDDAEGESDRRNLHSGIPQP
jgi:hypothetical protein